MVSKALLGSREIKVVLEVVRLRLEGRETKDQLGSLLSFLADVLNATKAGWRNIGGYLHGCVVLAWESLLHEALMMGNTICSLLISII